MGGSVLPTAGPAPLASAPPPPPGCAGVLLRDSPFRSVTGPRRAVRVLRSPSGEGSEIEEFNPSQPPHPLGGGRVSVQLGLVPFAGSFSGLGTELCIHPGAPDVFVPGKRTAPTWRTAPRLTPPPRVPGGQPRRAPCPVARPAAAGTPLDFPPSSPGSTPSRRLGRQPRAQGRCRARGLWVSGAQGHGGGLWRQQPRNANFLASPTSPQLVSYRRRGCREPFADWLPPSHL